MKNGRDGARGKPIIVRYDPATKKTKTHHDGRLRDPVLLARWPVHRRHQDLEPRHGRRDPRRLERPRAAADHRTTARRSRRPGRRPATASPTSTSTARPWTSGSPSSRASHRTGRSRRRSPLTEVSGLDANSRPDWFIPARRAAAADADPDPATDAERRRERQPGSLTPDPVATTYLDRLAARTVGHRNGPLPRPRPRPRRPCRPASRATCAGRRAVRDAARRGGGPARRGGQAEPRVLRGLRVGRDGGPGADPGDACPRTCRSSPTRSAATSARRRPGRRPPCSTSSARTR